MLSIEIADRVLDRAKSGVADFRLMNAVEEKHVLQALHIWREIGMGVPALLAELESLRAEVEAYHKRATDGINI